MVRVKVLALVIYGAFLSVAAAQDKAKDAHAARQPVFSQQLAMLDAERDEYATHLASHAANLLVAAKGNQANTKLAERYLGLSKRLSPRNRRAVVVDFQMRRGVLPEPVAGAFTPVALARLLLTRGQLLRNQEGAENAWVGRAFLQLAAELDPKNEDAVYASEIGRLEGGEFDWNAAPVSAEP